MQNLFNLIIVLTLVLALIRNLHYYNTGEQPKPRTKKSIKNSVIFGIIMIVFGSAMIVF